MLANLGEAPGLTVGVGVVVAIRCMVEVRVARVGEAPRLATEVRVGVATWLAAKVIVGVAPWLATESFNNHWNKKENWNLVFHC